MKLNEIGGGGTMGGATRMGQTIKGGDIARPAYVPKSSGKGMSTVKRALRNAKEKRAAKKEGRDAFIERPHDPNRVSGISPEMRDRIARNAKERKAAKAENRDPFVERMNQQSRKPSPELLRRVAEKKAQRNKPEQLF